MKLGEVIKTYRESTGLTMQEFANKAGLSKGYISMLEKNQHPQSQRPLTPSLETYQKVAYAMSLTLDDLIATIDGDEAVRLVHSDVLPQSEEKILALYRKLNASGQLKVCEYTSDLVASGNYSVSVGFDCQLAAHERTDVEGSEDDRKHDLDLLNDDDF
ncbi:MAG: helix-turn-helix domain-containing protein [Emergencia sp.]